MVRLGISNYGKTDIVFVDLGVKVKAKNYLDNIFIPVVKPFTQTMVGGQRWILQQDSVSAHKTKTVQHWCCNELPDFTLYEEWSPASPDLNPLDYQIWLRLETMACSKPRTSVEALKSPLWRTYAKFPMKEMQSSIVKWRLRLLA